MFDFTASIRRGLILAALVVPVLFASIAAAQSDNNPRGLSLPRFATTRSAPINVRVGPGTEYAIAWVFLKAGQPVEIVQEFDTWRKIRDVEGDEGWVHQSLLSGNRAAFIAPWRDGDPVALKTRGSEMASVQAWLATGMLVGVERCDGNWCKVIARGKGAEDGRDYSYSGFLAQSELWGVYQDEEFN
jgi:SH3-like domain-containing protein